MVTDPKISSERSGKRRLSQSRSRKTRQDILLTSRRHFAARGFDAASIREIADEIGVTHTVIRYHFGSKAQLWKDVVSEMYQELDTLLDAERLGIADLSGGAGMRTWLRHYIRYCANNPEHARIVIQESLVAGERQQWMDQYVKASHQRMLPHFRKLMSANELPDVWIISLFFSISAMCQLPFVLSNSVAGTYSVDMTSDAAIEAHTDSVLALLFRDQPPCHREWPDVSDAM